MYSDKFISIIIVSYNVCDLIINCINSIKKNISCCQYEIIVIDNASKDNTITRLKEVHDDIILIENKENIGFSKANNQGILLSRGGYILLLNPDTILILDPIEKAKEFLEKNKNVGVVGYRLLNFDKSLQMNTYTFPTLITEICHFLHVKSLLNVPLLKYFIKIFSPIFGKQINNYIRGNTENFEPIEVDMVAGAFMFLRRKAVWDVALFDENFFLYSEDIDLCRRIKQKGWKIYLLPTCPVIHYEGQSSKTNKDSISVKRYDGEFYYFRKHHKNWIIPLRIVVIISLSYRFLLLMLKSVVKPSKLKRLFKEDIFSYLYVIKNSFRKAP